MSHVVAPKDPQLRETELKPSPEAPRQTHAPTGSAHNVPIQSTAPIRCTSPRVVPVQRQAHSKHSGRRCALEQTAMALPAVHTTLQRGLEALGLAARTLWHVPDCTLVLAVRDLCSGLDKLVVKLWDKQRTQTEGGQVGVLEGLLPGRVRPRGRPRRQVGRRTGGWLVQRTAAARARRSAAAQQHSSSARAKPLICAQKRRVMQPQHASGVMHCPAPSANAPTAR
jgi:hypothetical protein